MIVYGIKNCDTVKKALQWLQSRQVKFEFHDYKNKGIDEIKLRDWSRQVGWESLMNKKGTTYRNLEESVKQKITDESSAIKVLMENTSMIRRPLIEKEGKVILMGFNEQEYLAKI